MQKGHIFMKINLKTLTLLPLFSLLFACTNNNDDSSITSSENTLDTSTLTSETSVEQSSISEETTSEESITTSDVITTKIVEYDLINISTMHGGDNISNDGPKNNLITYLNTYVPDSVSSLEVEGGVYIQEIVEKENESHNQLTIGSGGMSGSLTFNFNLDIKKVTLNVRSYYKYIEYSDTYSFDENVTAYLKSGDDEISKELLSANNAPSEQTELELEFVETVNTFTIYNQLDHNRILIDSIILEVVE